MAAERPSPTTDGTERLRVGVIGYGYWGPNLARNVEANSRMELAAVADFSTNRLAAAHAVHPWTRKTHDAMDIIRSSDIDAVVIATPPESHRELACAALEAGKHVLVEKPLATSPEDAALMRDTAERTGRVLMVDHTFLFTGAVRRIKQYLDAGELGTVYYFDSTRINLGLFQTRSNVLWDLAPHDVAMLLHLLDQPVTEVSAIGAWHVEDGLENIAYATLRFASGVIAHLHVNWLAPVKIRKTIIGGSRRMVVYDDMEQSEKVKLYDSGADRVQTKEDAYRAFVEYRTGDVLVPRLEKAEALAVECDHFLDVIAGAPSISGADLGLDVVRILHAAQLSMQSRGCPQEVER